MHTKEVFYAMVSSGAWNVVWHCGAWISWFVYVGTFSSVSCFTFLSKETIFCFSLTSHNWLRTLSILLKLDFMFLPMRGILVKVYIIFVIS